MLTTSTRADRPIFEKPNSGLSPAPNTINAASVTVAVRSAKRAAYSPARAAMPASVLGRSMSQMAVPKRIAAQKRGKK